MDLYNDRDNIFVDSLPDERALFRDICIELKQMDQLRFERFVNDLPVGLQVFVKNKVMLYKGTPGTSKTKMRTIFKVKTPVEFQK